MRRFIYYDKYGIESYLAQITRGIPISSSTETTNSIGIESQKSKEENKRLGLDMKALGFSPKIQKDANTGESRISSYNQLEKSLEEKILSDYAFEKVYDYFLNNNMLKTSNFEIGNVVILNEVVTFFDVDYFERFYSELGITNYLIKQRKTELKKSKDFLSRTQQKQNNEVKEKIKKEELKIKKEEEVCKSTLETLSMLKVTLPYTKFIVTNDCLIVLDEACFRDNPTAVAFKYGGNLQIVGYVTNIIESDSQSEHNDDELSEMYLKVNLVLKNTLFKDAKSVYLIHPLAVYY